MISQCVFVRLISFIDRGISSTVRRCIEKETGREFAAKIIDVGAESGDASPSQMLEATRQEIQILRQVMGHPYISKMCSIHKFHFIDNTPELRRTKTNLQILQLNYRMCLNQMPSYFLCLNCAEMANCSTI